MTRQQMFKVLTFIQNSVEFQNQDIMSICGFKGTTNEFISDHIMSCFKRLPPKRKGEILRRAAEAAVAA